jgi:hypothetical protein
MWQPWKTAAPHMKNFFNVRDNEVKNESIGIITRFEVRNVRLHRCSHLRNHKHCQCSTERGRSSEQLRREFSCISAGHSANLPVSADRQHGLFH